jgi:hypothetical protein
MGECGTHYYDNISKQQVDAILKNLQNDGATITGDNPWDVETNQHGVKLRGIWTEASLQLSVTVTDKRFYVPCYKIWARIDELMQHV